MKHLPFFAILVGCAVCQNCGVMNPNGKPSATFKRSTDNSDVEPHKRIVGGRNAAPGELPFQVSLFLRKKATDTSGFACGASVISKRCVLTAAHCFFACSGSTYVNLTNAIATFGAYNLKNNDAREKIQSSDFRVHNGYQPCSNNLKNDIAVIRFNQDIPLGLTADGYKSVGTICRATSNDYSNAKVSGWGATSGGGATSDILKIADMVKQQPCTNFAVDQSQVCAVTPSNQKNNGCNGDSGGPFFTVTNGRAYQVGIFSYGTKGCTPGTSNVFTSVSSFATWINSNCGI